MTQATDWYGVTIDQILTGPHRSRKGVLDALHADPDVKLDRIRRGMYLYSSWDGTQERATHFYVGERAELIRDGFSADRLDGAEATWTAS